MENEEGMIEQFSAGAGAEADAQALHAEYAQNRAWSGRGTLQELVGELERQKASKLDVVVDTRHLATISPKSSEIRLSATHPQAIEVFGSKDFPIGDKALDQLAYKSIPSIPPGFLKELLKTDNDLAMNLVNQLLIRHPERRLIRTLDGKVRAFLSNRYRILDNFDLAFTAMDVVKECKGQIFEASLSDTHMRLKFTSQEVWDALDLQRKEDKSSWYAGGLGNQDYLNRVHARTFGDLPGGPGSIHPIITISNSETGHGGLNVRVGLLLAICFNIATVERTIQQVHLGERLEEGIFTEETISADSKAIMLKARDSIRSAFNRESFSRLVDKAREAQDRKIDAPTLAVNNIVKENGLSEEDKTNILQYFLKDYTPTSFGLSQAVARRAQDTEDADRAFELEEIAGKVLVGA